MCVELDVCGGHAWGVKKVSESLGSSASIISPDIVYSEVS